MFSVPFQKKFSQQKNNDDYYDSVDSSKDRYFITNDDVKIFINRASEFFNHFRMAAAQEDEERASYYLKKCMSFYQDAIERSGNNLHDKAYCQRRYATVIERDHFSDKKERYLQAKDLAEQSIDNYRIGERNEKNSADIIVLEIQRALHFLGKVAFVLDDGDLVGKIISPLFDELDKVPNDAFYLDGLMYTYKNALSIGKYDIAEESVQLALNVYEEKNSDKFLYEYKHYLLEIRLLKSYCDDKLSDKASFLTRDVKNVFWTVFDEDKKRWNTLCQAKFRSKNSFLIKNRLIKDLKFLLCIKIVEDLFRTRNNNKTIWIYIIQQIKECFPHSNTSFLKDVKGSMKKKLKKIEKEGGICFSSQWFLGRKAPRISVSRKNFRRLFPEIKETPNDSIQSNDNLSNQSFRH